MRIWTEVLRNPRKQTKYKCNECLLRNLQ
ncbi:hypothetical protein FO512_17730 [Bacillus cereus]|nr:hypothetical protein [Bacillus cereus]